MAAHSSLTLRKEKSHTIDASLKRRARLQFNTGENAIADPLCIGNK